MKYKRDHNKPVDSAKLDLFEGIANEIAEQNRLQRLVLKMQMIQTANANTVKQGTDEEGKPIILPLTEEEQKEYDLTLQQIDFVLQDHNGKIETPEEETQKVICEIENCNNPVHLDLKYCESHAGSNA